MTEKKQQQFAVPEQSSNPVPADHGGCGCGGKCGGGKKAGREGQPVDTEGRLNLGLRSA